MSRCRPSPVLFAVLAVLSLSVGTSAQSNALVAGSPVTRDANAVPPTPVRPSPVAYFRELLAMTAEERDGELSKRMPEQRAKILAKVEEYERIPAEERELRLRATELRFYLLPLLRTPATNRADRLAMIPEVHRELVEARLSQWDMLPLPLGDEFMENEAAVRFFTRLDPASAPTADDLLEGMLPDEREQMWADIARWQALPAEQRQRMIKQFHHFFELTPSEQDKALRTLSEQERRAMEKAFQTFVRLPPSQRVKCVTAFERFASMSPVEQARFLRNAQHWQNMSPTERQEWRDLVRRLSEVPPLPPGVTPILPYSAPPLPLGAGTPVAASTN